ncbi:hypothetical protein MUK42_36012 [Musa troglodytarum]|uniref:Uncharacterized protein n=1 Tax=Musa troglodytarum TaxID=320322 RepID=A0A9E7E8D7_9LILI|nr:hypothetical protein MUK42_36012 [Musa troglodytarum]
MGMVLKHSLLIPHSTSAHSLIDGRDLLSFSRHRSASPSTLSVAPTAAGLLRNRGSIATTASPSLNLRIACSDPTSSRRTRHRKRGREEVDVLCRTACTYPSRGDAFPVVAVALDGAPPCDDLHEEDAEGVHVALLRELVGPEVLRVEVPRGALDLGGDVRRLRILRRQPCETEIRHLRPELVRQQDVGGLDVSVDDWTLSSIKLLGQTWGDLDVPTSNGTQLDEHNRIGSDRAIYWSSNLLDELFNLDAFVNLRNLYWAIDKWMLIG